MQQKVDRGEKIEALCAEVKALAYLDLKLMRDLINQEMEEKSVTVHAEFRSRLAELSEAYGIAVSDVVGKKKHRSKKPPGEKVVRYRNPEEPNKTWSGIGRKPTWLRTRLEAGVELSTFAVEQPEKGE